MGFDISADSFSKEGNVPRFSGCYGTKGNDRNGNRMIKKIRLNRQDLGKLQLKVV